MFAWREDRRSRIAPVVVVVGALALSLAAAGCGGDAEPEPEPLPPHVVDALPSADALPAGWNSLEPGGETTCSDGSTYRFFARNGASNRLLVFFQGGGACWSGATCDVEGDPSYIPVIADMDPATFDGVFALDREDNPFREHDMVFVPYCTGDVHLGDALRTYTAPGAEEGTGGRVFEIRHQGHDNAMTVLEWAFRNFQPESVFVTGSSAGSIPSPYFAARVAERWPEARVTQLGDGSGGYRGRPAANPAERWQTIDVVDDAMPSFAGTAPEDFSFPQLYIAAARLHPEIQLASYDTAEDDVQRQFQQLSGFEAAPLQPSLDANLAEIAAAVPGFVSYVAGGELHTILRRPEFYTYRVGDVRFRDWVADLAAGAEVESVHCEDCSVAEMDGPEPMAAEPEEPAPTPSH